MKNYYDILEISVDASKEQIKEAYRKLAVVYHPDKNINSDSTVEMFKDINEAKQILFDDVKKAEYDLMLTDWVLAHHKDNFKKKSKIDRVHNYGTNLNLKSKRLGKLALSAAAVLIIIVFFVNYFEDNSGAKPAYLSNKSENVPAQNTESGKGVLATKAITPETKKQQKPSAQITNETKAATVVAEAAEKKVTRQNELAAMKVIEKTKVEKLKASKEISTKAIAERDIAARDIGTKGIGTKDIVATNIAVKEIVEETVAEEQFSAQEMSKIISNIRREKARTNNTSNCVQVCKTRNSNVQNAFDIARLLGQEGFIIAGRETVRGDNEGVQIDASGSCIRIVIGVYKPG